MLQASWMKVPYKHHVHNPSIRSGTATVRTLASPVIAHHSQGRTYVDVPVFSGVRGARYQGRK